jgi:hypothetical protein
MNVYVSAPDDRVLDDTVAVRWEDPDNGQEKPDGDIVD